MANRVYYNQADSRWAWHPYPAPGYEKATVKTAGCGPTCAAMIVSSCKEAIRPDTMCDISKQNGYRVSGGTSDGLFSYVSQRWGIEMKRVYSSFEAHQACKEGYFVVICCGAGLWTTGGHYILAVGANDSEIEIFDPYLYAGKFDINGRAGKVRLNGNSAWVEINTFKANSNAQRFFAFKIDGNAVVNTPQSNNESKVAWINTQSLNLNVRNNPNGAVVGSLPKGTQVVVYEERDGWSRIGDGKWVSSSYLAYSAVSSVNSSKTMYVSTNSANLNVRDNPNGNITGSLAKGTAVNVVETRDGWARITSPKVGWVSMQYLSGNGSTVSRASTVGQTKRFRGNTLIYANASLSGTYYTYKANTSVKVLQNVSGSVDKVSVLQTGRIGYVNTNVYK